MVHLGFLLTASSALRRGLHTRGLVVASAASDTAKRVVFLGTPECAARSLELLVAASRQEASSFELAAVVSNPPARSGRKMKLTPSPVQTLAEAEGLPLFTPPNAKDEDFLSALEELQPDLCITAAYGCFLPQRFLDIPAKGTLNIHPSLLPLYRGAAPLQRCLEAGDAVGGVTVAFTVLKMDAGPILRQEERELNGDEQFPQLLLDFFEQGTELLLDALPSVWDGTCETIDQDGNKATAAKKIQPYESELRLSELGARAAHNRVRAFAGSPGCWCLVSVDGAEPVRAKLLETRVADEQAEGETPTRAISLKRNALRFACDDGSVLEVLRITMPGKKPVDAKSFWNGLNGRKAEWAVGDVSQEEVARLKKEAKAKAQAQQGG